MRYTRAMNKSGIGWPWVGMGIILLVFLTSGLNARNSVAWAGDLREVIVHAVERGDYELAEELLQQYTNTPMHEFVLGTESELEDKVYPERVVERRIAELENKLVDYPGYREIYRMLGELYDQLDNQVKASDYREKARILDPNN